MKSPLGTLLRPRNTAPVPYTGRNQVRLPWYRPGGAESQMRAMGSVGTLFAIVDRLATSTAAPDWALYRDAKPGERDEDRVKVTSHLALDIWNRPNPFFTRQLLIETAQQHYDLVGEGWLVVARNPRARSIPLELWPVRPDRMMPIPDRNDYLVGYVYTGPDGEQVPLQLDEVIFTRRPNPLDPYRGIGPVQTILADLEGVRLSAEWNRNFFSNSAEPGGLIKYDHRLDDEEFNEVTTRWREQHQGVANAHRVAVIEGNAEWVDRKYTNRDMQFVELRGASREVIREAYGIPKFAVGDVEDINRATADAAKSWFAEQMTVPRLERWKQVLNTQFLLLFGKTGTGLEFDYVSPVPEDREADNQELTAKSTAAAVLVTAGYDGAAVLETVGLPPMPFVGARGPAVPPAPPGESPEPPPAARLELGAAPRAIAQPVRAAEGDQPEPELPDLEPVQQSWTDALEALLTQWAAITATWTTALVARIRALITSGDRADLADLAVPAADVDRGAELLTTTMTQLARDAAAQVVHEAAQQGVTIDTGAIGEDELGEAAHLIVDSLAREMSLSAGREAMRISLPGVDGAEEAERVASSVREHLDELTDARPRLWLGNGLTQAQHAGRTATMRAAETGRTAPSVAYYGQEQNDSNTCELCREIDGRWLGNTVADTLRDYPTGGYVRCLGGPRCRGMVAAVYRPQTTGDAA